LGRNLFIGNKEASNIEVLKVDGKNKYRAILLSSNGSMDGVARPEAILLDPADG
jgi:low density lipoprotein-related protein 2